MPRAAVLVLPLLVAGCTGNAAAPAADRQSPPPAAAASPSLAARPPADDAQVTGTIAETMDAGGYTYLRLKTASGEVWAAVNQAKLAPGSEVTIGNANWMEGFESKTLNRRFDRILFGSLVTPGGGGALPPGHPDPASGGADLGDVKVDKAPGQDGRTVAEIHSSKASLKGAEVVVRGKVVKWNPGIMGRNWVHLRDGSGSAETQDHDLAVTTSETVAKGDVVVVRGTLALDRDFGAGYVYPVILENARIVK